MTSNITPTPEQLAKDLTTITGGNFTVANGLVTAGKLEGEQFSLLYRVAAYSGLIDRSTENENISIDLTSPEKINAARRIHEMAKGIAPEQLAQDLGILTGAKFKVKGDEIIATNLTGDQLALLRRTSMELNTKANYDKAIVTHISSKPQIVKAYEVHEQAIGEPARIDRLKAAIPLLKRKLGIDCELNGLRELDTKIVFRDRDPNVLFGLGVLVGHGPTHQAIVERLEALNKQGVLGINYLRDYINGNPNDPAIRVTVCSVDSEKLSTLPDIVTPRDLGRKDDRIWAKE